MFTNLCTNIFNNISAIVCWLAIDRSSYVQNTYFICVTWSGLPLPNLHKIFQTHIWVHTKFLPNLHLLNSRASCHCLVSTKDLNFLGLVFDRGSLDRISLDRITWSKFFNQTPKNWSVDRIIRSTAKIRPFFLVSWSKLLLMLLWSFDQLTKSVSYFLAVDRKF